VGALVNLCRLLLLELLPAPLAHFLGGGACALMLMGLLLSFPKTARSIRAWKHKLFKEV